MQTIDARPTKELFIDMLTRDIKLSAAILDLIDNCVDGARRLRPNKSFDGLFVKIVFSKDDFSVKDNCGGIPLEVAEKYAFRFGRPNDAPTTKHSIGRFGVGMKRAIFKLGRQFSVESMTTNDCFKVSADVDAWASIEKWEFQFSERKEKQKNPIEKAGTKVTISKLLKEAEETFSRQPFASELADELQKRLSEAIENKLKISINGIPVDSNPVKLLSNTKLAPAHLEKRYKLQEGGSVDVVLYCGLGPSEDVAAAGWHVYCNGRLILNGEKSETTGWGSVESGISMPGFHGQFNLVRGYAYFDSEDAALLPWNTTKTGINPESAIYRAVRLEMMRLMRPVVDFCNKLKDEKENMRESGDTGPLQILLDGSTVEVLEGIKSRSAFVMPKTNPNPQRTGPAYQRIQYDELLSKVLEVKKAIKATSFKDVGEKTFAYYYNAEIKK